MITKQSVSLLFLFLLLSGLCFGQDGPAKAPEKETLTLNPDDLGNAVNTVNLFSGEVTFPVTLASMPGRNGLAISLNATYNSAGATQHVTTWNREVSTGIMGLGWQIDRPRIVVDNKSTGSREDDEYYLIEGGSSNKLILTNFGSGIREYALENYQFWKILHYRIEEKWVITHEDGTAYTYGDKNSVRNTIEWIVAWDNWIGSSSRTTNQSQQPLVFNISTIENRLGDKIEYEYRNIDRFTGSSTGEKHTEASYLERIESSTGEEIVLIYQSKGSGEYYEPHTEQAEPDAYQERYEKEYLSSVEVYNYLGNKVSGTHLTYGSIGLGDLTKKILTGIDYENIYGKVTPGFDFTYNTSGNVNGKISTVTTSSGGVISYTYANDAVQPVYSARDLTINAPSGYAEPEIHYGPDYVLVTWRQLNTDGSHDNGNRPVKVYMYTWEGYWKEEFLTTIPDVQLENGFRKAYSTVTGKDFFAISRWDPFSNYNYYVYLYSRDKTTGKWKISEPGGYYETAEQLGRPTLLAGDNYVALHTFRDGDIITYVRNGNVWERKVINQFGNEWHSTGTNSWIMSHQKGGDDYLKFHYLNEERNWVTKSVPYAFLSDHDDNSYWHASNSFAVAMADDNPEFIYSWDENYSNFMRHDVMGAFADQSQVLIQDNSLVSVIQENKTLVPDDKIYYYNTGKLARYDGSTFQTSGSITGWGRGGISVGSDYFTYQSDPRYNDDDYIDAYVQHFNPNTNEWVNGITSFYKETNNYFYFDTEFPLEPGLESVLLLNKFYKKSSNGTFQFERSITTPSTERISNFAAFHPLDYIIYSTMDENGVHLGHKIHLIKNGNLKPAVSGINFVYSSYSNRTTTYSWEVYQYLFAGSTYATTDVWQGFENATTLTLHRVINDAHVGLQSHFPVVQVTIDDGIDSTHTSFEYDATTARFDPSGISAQYEHVTTIPGSANPSIRPYGYTKTSFYNMPTAISKGNLLLGTPYQSGTFDKDGVQVANSYTSFTLLSTTINTTDFYYVRPSKISNKIDGVTTSVTHTYKPESGLISSSETTNYNSMGETETLKKELKYGYEAYPALKDDNLLTAVVQQRSFNGTTVTSSAATKWEEQNGKLLPKTSYTWKGTGASDFTAWITTPSSDWLNTSEITGRDTAFNITETKDIDDIYSTIIYGHDRLVPLGTFQNARQSGIFMDDFNDGNFADDQPASWFNEAFWELLDKKVMGNNVAGDAAFHAWSGISGNYIAEFRVKLDPVSQAATNTDGLGFHFGKNSKLDAPSSNGILFNINPYAGIFTLSSPADGTVATVALTDNPFSWHNYRVVKENNNIKVYIDGKRIINATVTEIIGSYFGFYLSRAKGYIDDVRIYPDNASAVTTSYDPKYLIPESQVNEDGLYTQTLLDETTPVAQVNAKGLTASTVAGYSPKVDGSALSPVNLLISHTTAPMGTEGFVEDFSMGDRWNKIERDNGSTSTWNVENGKLHHTNSGGATDYTTDMYYVELPDNLEGRIGVEFSLRSPIFSDNYSVGIGIGGDAWNFSNGGNELAVWTGLYADDLRAHNVSSGWTNYKANLELNSTYRIKILLDIPSQTADYFVDGKLLLQDYPFRVSSDDIKKLAFYNYGRGTVTSEFYIDNLVVYSDPVQSSVFIDAAGKQRQQLLQEDDNNVLVSETVYDAIGRAAVQTKSTKVSGELTFKENFVTSCNLSTGQLYGDVNTINGDDYAGVKVRFENSLVGRTLETSSPGYTYRIGGGKNTTTAHFNGNTSPVGMGEGYDGQQYKATNVKSPDGGENYTFTDKAGNVVMQKSGTVPGKEKQPVYTSKTLLEGESFNFTPDVNHQVSYDYKDKSGSSTKLKIGTDPGASDVVFSEYNKTGTFTAIDGQTYYVEITYTEPEPEPVYYDYDCVTIVEYDPNHCYDENNCRIDCPSDPCTDPNKPCVESESETTINKLGSTLVIDYSTSSQFVDTVIYLTTKYQYDDYGNLIKLYPPNYHNPQESTDPNLYVTTNTYDFLGRLKSSEGPDEGLSRYIYNEETGRLRFMQDAQAMADGNILYTKYDDFGRIIETGYYTEPWDEDYLQTEANSSPDFPSAPDPTTWRKRYTYGAHGAFTSDKANLVKIEINNDTDDNAEVIETYAHNETGELISKRIEMPAAGYSHTIRYAYDNAGNLIEEDYTQGPGKVVYGYDMAGRLKTIGNDSIAGFYASYEYDINGALHKEITSNGAFIKTLTYDIPGRLTEVDDNNFNETLSYNSGGYAGTGYYGGPVARTTFDYKKGSPFDGYSDSYHYAYGYDKLGQLKVAENSINSAWEIGTASPITYDANGNILSTQKGSVSKTYTYDNGTNKINRTTGSARQYHYDGNGNVTQSTPLNLTFNYDPFFNKTMSVTHATGSTSFLYQGDGERVYKKVTEGSDWNETFYVRGAGDYPLIEKYKDSNGNEETRYYIYGAGGLVAMMHSFEATFSSSATMEEGSLAVEQQQFEMDGGNGHRVNAKLFNHTPGDSSRYSLRLSGRPGAQQGLSFIHQVRKGDTVRMEVFAKYVKNATGPDADALVMALASMATGAATPGAAEAGGTVTSGTEPGQDALLPGGKDNNGKPEAYLNYILYDTLFNLLDAGFIPVSEAAEENGSNIDHERLFIEKVSGHDGYMQAFVSNDSEETTDVYFDDMTMSVSSTDQLYFVSTDHLGSTRALVRDDGTVMARYDYNPWGELIRSEITEDITYQYTGQEKDKELGLLNFRARFYDAELGRFYGIDPQGQFSSPYAGMGNNPVIYVDPDGEWFGVDDAIVAGLGFVSGYVIHGISTGEWGKDAFIAGGITAGAAWLTYNTAGAASGVLAKVGFGAKTAAVLSSGVGGAVGSFGGSIAGQAYFNQGNIDLGLAGQAALYGFGGGMASGLVDISPLMDKKFAMHHTVKHLARSSAFQAGGNLILGKNPIENNSFGLDPSVIFPLAMDGATLTSRYWAKPLAEKIIKKNKNKLKVRGVEQVDVNEFDSFDIYSDRKGDLRIQIRGVGSATGRVPENVPLFGGAKYNIEVTMNPFKFSLNKPGRFYGHIMHTQNHYIFRRFWR
jgi:RHS repeat-associated protein